jgi:hypothetical protein
MQQSGHIRLYPCGGTFAPQVRIKRDLAIYVVYGYRVDKRLAAIGHRYLPFARALVYQVDRVRHVLIWLPTEGADVCP